MIAQAKRISGGGDAATLRVEKIVYQTDADRRVLEQLLRHGLRHVDGTPLPVSVDGLLRRVPIQDSEGHLQQWYERLERLVSQLAGKVAFGLAVPPGAFLRSRLAIVPFFDGRSIVFAAFCADEAYNGVRCFRVERLHGDHPQATYVFSSPEMFPNRITEAVARAAGLVSDTAHVSDVLTREAEHQCVLDLVGDLLGWEHAVRAERILDLTWLPGLAGELERRGFDPALAAEHLAGAAGNPELLELVRTLAVPYRLYELTPDDVAALAAGE